MFPYRRLEDIFSYIKCHIYTPCAILAKQSQVSERTIRSDVQLLNDLLQQHGAQIVLVRQKGYQLHIVDKPQFQQFTNSSLVSNKMRLETSTQRIRFLLHHLLYSDTYSSLDFLADLVFVGKNTMINHLKEIKEVCDQYHLALIFKPSNGYKLIGDEEAKRKCMMGQVLSCNTNKYVSSFSNEEYQIFQDVNLDYIQRIINKHLQANNIQTTDFNRKNLIIHVALMLSRILHGYQMNGAYTLQLDASVEVFFHNILMEIEAEFSCKITEIEKHYLYCHIMANTNMQLCVLHDETIFSLVHETLAIIFYNYHFDLRNDDILKNDLFVHYRSIITTKELHINKRNPLLHTLKTSFPLAFEITLISVIEVFKSIQIDLTEDEVGYISLHIGAAIERCFSGTMQMKHVFLLCGSGQASTRMLEARLHAYFRDKVHIKRILSLNEFEQLSTSDYQGIDFVISTISLENDDLPIIFVDFSLRKNDIENISYQLNLLSSKKTNKISKFFSEDSFLHIRSCNDKPTLLRLLNDKLLKNQYVDYDFIDSVLQREALSNTAMNDMFALPHAIGLIALKTKVAVAILDEPLKWNNKNNVQIVFLLAMNKDDYLDIEYLYDIFLQFINNTKLQQAILETSDYLSFMHVLLETIKDGRN